MTRIPVYDRLMDSARILRQSVKSAQKWHTVNFNAVPAIFGNAMPKSGSHLITQILKGLMMVAPLRYLTPAPVRTITGQGRNRTEQEILHDLGRLRNGAMSWGYLRSNPENIRFFQQNPQIIPFHVFRDPRDRLISSIFYAVDMHKGHAQHTYYASLEMADCITTAIQGRPEPGLLHLPNVREHYDRYLGWHNTPEMLCLRFENLVQEPIPSLNQLLDFLERRGLPVHMDRTEAVGLIREAIRPEKSATFRKGTSGQWKEYFTPEHKQLFKDITGDLLIELGYETNNDW